MKFKYLAIVFIFLILALGIGAAAAEDTTVAGHRFTVPDDYSVTFKNVSQVYMGNDSDHALLIAVPVDFRGIPEFKYQMSQAGYDIDYEGNNFTQNGFEISAYNFTKDDYLGIVYFAQGDDELFVLTYVYPDGEDIDLRPLDTVLDSLKT